MKTLRHSSALAEKQTVKVSKINNRVSVRRREYEPGKFTNDILVDGDAGARVAIGDSLIHKFAYEVAARHPDALDSFTEKHLTEWLYSRFTDWEDKKQVFLDYLYASDADDRAALIDRGWNSVEAVIRNDWPEKFV